MNYNGKKAENVKIAYIGGGSRGWAWRLMCDLVLCEDVSGDIYLYDIDYEAAKNNEIIGNRVNSGEGAKTVWNYHAVKNAEEAYKDADFVIISILPGTLDEMESDVHTPEKYGIYQSVGDTVGPGGIVRAMRAIPMIEEIAECVKKYCPNAWVINYTNPMTMCVKALYRVFPEIKAFGCCHEVFGMQSHLSTIIGKALGEEGLGRNDIKINPVAVNHFTWLTEAKYKNIDIFPYYREYCKNCGPEEVSVKVDLFNRYGFMAAAGDRHLAEFCEGKWYLEITERVKEMNFELTTVSYRKDEFNKLVEKSERLCKGEEEVEIKPSGEEGANQIRALLGLGDLVTNVNIPNRGQTPNLPLGAVIETNAVFRGDSVIPVFAGEVPKSIYAMVSRICAHQEMLSDAIAERDVKKIFSVFANDPLVTCSLEDSKKLFKEMVENTKKYLTSYDLSEL